MTNDFHTCLHFLSWLTMSPPPQVGQHGVIQNPYIFFISIPHFIGHQDLWILTAHTTEIITDLTFPIPHLYSLMIWEQKLTPLDCGSLACTTGPGTCHTDCFVKFHVADSPRCTHIHSNQLIPGLYQKFQEKNIPWNICFSQQKNTPTFVWWIINHTPKFLVSIEK